MDIDLELYRRDVRLPGSAEVHLSVIDVCPERPQHTLVFVHGFGGKAGQWQHQLRHFSGPNRVIAPDLRGHGRSHKPRQAYTMPQMLADLNAVLVALGVSEPVVMLGHSFGGAIATEFCLAHPQRVERLALLATAGEFQLNPLYRFALGLPPPALRFVEPLVKGWLGAPLYVLQSLYNNSLCCWKGWNQFRRLDLPTLVVRGHLDAVFEQPLFEEVGRAIPGLADEVDVGASGHLVMLERREAVNRAIERFLEPSPRAWSQTERAVPSGGRAALMKERPWLPYYDEGVPDTIAVPQASLDTLLELAARRFPRHPAILFEGRRIGYQKLNQAANQFANALLKLGLQKGERVMLVLPNTPQMVIGFYGVLRAGGVAVFTLPTTQPDELVRQIRAAGVSFLVTLTQFDELIQQIRPELPVESSPLRQVIFTHIADYLPWHKRLAFQLSMRRRKLHLLDIALDGGMHRLAELLAGESRQAPELPAAPGDLAVIQYTGGVTDEPKGVMLSHRSLLANTLQTRHWMPEAREGQERFLCVLPFTHSYGLTTALNLPVSIAATLIIKARFEVGEVLNEIQSARPTIFPGVPQMYLAINDYPGVRRFGIDSIKACLSGAAPLPVEVQEAFEKLTHGRLVEGYGLTEASPVTHANPLNGLRKVGHIGIPMPSTEARIVDLRKGRKVMPVGQVGELAVRGPQVMLGYWDNPQATAQAITPDGWLLTGDVAQMDADGYFRIIARKADMWYPTRPGSPAFPRDVEEVLYEIPQVKEAAVVAIAGQPVAFVIRRGEKRADMRGDGRGDSRGDARGDKRNGSRSDARGNKRGDSRGDALGADALIAYARRRLPPELAPRLVIFVDDFPRTFIGKVLRRELRRRFEASGRDVTEIQT